MKRKEKKRTLTLRFRKVGFVRGNRWKNITEMCERHSSLSRRVCRFFVLSLSVFSLIPNICSLLWWIKIATSSPSKYVRFSFLSVFLSLDSFGFGPDHCFAALSICFWRFLFILSPSHQCYLSPFHCSFSHRLHLAWCDGSSESRVCATYLCLAATTIKLLGKHTVTNTRPFISFRSTGIRKPNIGFFLFLFSQTNLLPPLSLSLAISLYHREIHRTHLDWLLLLLHWN